MRHRVRTGLGVALTALAILAAACNPFGGLGPDELPGEIGPQEREQIEKTLVKWLRALNDNDIGVSSEYTLTPGEMGSTSQNGIAAYERLTVEVSSFTAEGLSYEFQALGLASIEGDHVVVEFVTNFGRRQTELVRRVGVWRMTKLPRMLVATEEGPISITTTIHRAVQVSPTQRTWLVEFTNDSDVPALWFSAWILTVDADGNAISPRSANLWTQSFLRPGESTLVRIDGAFDESSNRLDAIVPVFRRAFEGDQGSVVDVPAGDVTFVPATASGNAMVTATVPNPALGAINASVLAAVYDRSGGLLALLPWVEGTGRLAPGEIAEVSIVVPAESKAGDGVAAELLVRATIVR